MNGKNLLFEKKSLSFAKRKNLKKKIAQKFLLTAFNLKR
jgi:hypothetical protein